MPTHHDSAFKRMFGHPELVRALLELVPNCPAGAADGFDRLNCSFVSSSERQRIADMVWRVYGKDFVFYLVLEFQSTIDQQMAQRIKVYTGLLSQELFVQHKLPELLNILPVVVYSGRRKWRKTEAAGPDWLKPLQVGEVFLLIDEESAGDSIVGDVIRLARAASLGDVIRSQQGLLAWPLASEGLRRDVLQVAGERLAMFGVKQEVIMKESGKANIERKFSEQDLAYIHQFIESLYMVYKDDPEVRRIMKALVDARLEGAEEGRQEGRQEGLQEGRADALKAALSKACQQHKLGHDAARKIANADTGQLESWLDRLIAGERLQEMLEEQGP